jgi:hypothetical protein
MFRLKKFVTKLCVNKSHTHNAIAVTLSNTPQVGHNWPIYFESQRKVGEHSSRSVADFVFGHI